MSECWDTKILYSTVNVCDILTDSILTEYTNTWSLIAYNTSSTTDNINGLQFIATSMLSYVQFNQFQ